MPEVAHHARRFDRNDANRNGRGTEIWKGMMTVGRTRAAARVIKHPGIEDLNVQQVLEALADPARRSVVCRLAREDTALSCGSFDLPVSRSTSTHHFNVLRKAGLLRQYYVGTTKMNALRTDDLEHRFPGLLTAIIAATHTQTTPPDTTPPH